jgi:DNA-binding Xre family transcriptional regulator
LKKFLKNAHKKVISKTSLTNVKVMSKSEVKVFANNFFVHFF